MVRRSTFVNVLRDHKKATAHKIPIGRVDNGGLTGIDKQKKHPFAEEHDDEQCQNGIDDACPIRSILRAPMFCPLYVDMVTPMAS